MFKVLESALGPIHDEDTIPDARYEPIDGIDGEDLTNHVQTKKSDERGVYWYFWVLGAGVLLSWNVLICTIPLLSSFFAAESSTRANLASWLSTVYCFGNLFFLGLAQRDVGHTSPSPRLHSALVLLLILSLLLTFPLLPLVLPSFAPNSPLLLPLLLIIALLLSVSCAYLQSAVFALAALWGSNETLAVMSGQGGIAVLVSGAQVILAIVSALHSGTPVESGSAAQSTLAGVGLWAIGSLGAVGCMIAHRHLLRHPDYSLVLAPVRARRQALEQGSESIKTKEMSMTRHVFRKNIALEAAVAWVFVVTLSVFPPITTAILSIHAPPPRLLQPAVFIPIHFVVFNIGDYVGRTYLPSISFLFTTSHTRVLRLSLTRTLFIPLFLLCNITSRSTSSNPFINSDLAYLLILVFFGMSNGWISSLSMILASSPTLNPRIADEEKDVAGTLAAFCLVAGLAGGSISSFGVNWLVRGNALG